MVLQTDAITAGTASRLQARVDVGGWPGPIEKLVFEFLIYRAMRGYSAL
jgi:hypothetical protein